MKLFEQRRLERLRYPDSSKFIERSSRERLEPPSTIRAKSNTTKFGSDVSFTQRKTQGKRSKSYLNPLYEFLEDVGLNEHYHTFTNHGIDDLETLKEVNEQHLISLKIPIAHRIKLLNKLGKGHDPWLRPVLKEKTKVEQATGDEEVSAAKTSCWKCFKVFPPSHGVFACHKLFCSVQCRDKHLLTRRVECICGKSLLKDEAFLIYGQWRCASCRSVS